MDTTTNYTPDPGSESGESLSEKKLKKDYIPPKLNVAILAHEEGLISGSSGNSCNPGDPPAKNSSPSAFDE